MRECSVLDREKFSALTRDSEPDVVYHLAAQSLIPKSWEDPWLTFDTNVQGTITLFEALKDRKDVKVVVASSSAAYGDAEVPFTEDQVLKPVSPYGVSKAAQDLLSYQYWRNYGVHAVNARIFNTTGPGKDGDVHSSFAKKVIEIEAGKEKRGSVRVGNLKIKREVNHVKDLCSSLALLAEKGNPGESYNCCSGKPYSLKEILATYTENSSAEIEAVEDESLRRASDELVVAGDNSKLKALGWKQEHSLDDTVKDVLGYWRGRLSKK